MHVNGRIENERDGEKEGERERERRQSIAGLSRDRYQACRPLNQKIQSPRKHESDNTGRGAAASGISRSSTGINPGYIRARNVSGQAFYSCAGALHACTGPFDNPNNELAGKRRQTGHDPFPRFAVGK